MLCADKPDDQLAAITDTVREHGWCALRIAAQVDFAYTVGLRHSFQRPEIVMFGLDGEDMQNWLNAAVDLGREHGWPADDTDVEGVIEAAPVRLRAVHPSWHEALFGTAERFYDGDEGPFLQLVWPDEHGLWPWDEGVVEGCRTQQAHTWLPVDEHPPGGWRLVGELAPDFDLPAAPDSYALTTRSVLAGGQEPAWIGFDDSVFDVLDERGHAADDLCLAFLGELVVRYPGLRDCDVMEEGQALVRENGGWVSTDITADERAASERAWQSVQEA
ncbi:hypothetical protein Acsp05_05000 [Actinokineospora sp. NBRC 105648]|nr:hypothetical protein Acsp05_05000 [Actinokineospora sp. NBRC 105648]